jgi:hypothetical protein
MVCAISAEYGVEATLFYDKRLDSKMFTDLLHVVKTHHNQKFILVGDNATIHTSKFTKQAAM